MKSGISIITPSLNQGKYIEKAILSVIDQQYENLEYIIIDGGSTDNTLEIIRKYQDRISYFTSGPDLGQSDAINKGLRIASGDIFTWLNADDFYEQGSLQKVADNFRENPGCDIFCGTANILSPDGTNQRQSKGVITHKKLAHTIGWPVINQPETFFRRRILEQTGLLSINLRYNMDKELWIKYLLTYGQQWVFKSDDVLVNFRLHETSKSMSELLNFTPERDAIFLGIAKWAGLNDELGFLVSKLQMRSFDYVFHLEAKPDKDVMHQIFQYFILLKADEYYVSGDYEKMKICLRRLNPLQIQESMALYLKLMSKKLFR